MSIESGYWVHICLFSQSASTSSSDQKQPHSLDEIQRKVDRPLDARFFSLSVETLNIPRRQVVQARVAEMSSKGQGRKKENGRAQSPLPLVSSSPSPTALISPKHSNFTADSTPVARFIKESSFAVEDDKGSSSRESKLEVFFGIVHLFRDDAALHDLANAKTKTALEDDTGTILAILGVPSHVGPSKFLQFVEPATNAISQVRMIREERAQRCMVLLKFRDAANAEEFHKMYADQPFDFQQDPNELCRVVYVTKVSISTTSTLPYAYPLLANSDPWPIMTNNVALSENAAAHPPPGTVSVELPTCPVCLERMDASVTGLMTVTCQHTFHCSCLSRWSDARCPVCRYTQSRDIPSFVPDHGCCAVCGTLSDLWVCLVCATIGCGRYKAGHAHKHFQETGHLFSLELETQRVWNYGEDGRGDGYVHRLIQNKIKNYDEKGPTPIAREQPFGKGSRLMEASSSAAGQSRDAKGQVMSEVEEKMEAIGLEYSHLLSTQLESQRAFYEDQVRVYQRRAEEAGSEIQNVRMNFENAERERMSLRQSLEVVTSRYESAHKNLEKSLGRIKALDDDLKGERLMSKGLICKIEKLENDGEDRKQDMMMLGMENQDLKEQVRDLMAFVETRDTIEKQGGEEMRGGSITVGKGKQSSSTSTETKAKSAKNKKKKVKRKAVPVQTSSDNQIDEEEQEDEED